MIGFLMLSWLDYFLLLSVLLIFLYFYLTKNYGHFDKNRIPYEKPYLLFGSMLELFLKPTSLNDMILRLYKRSKENGGLFGLFERSNPVIVLGTQEFVKLATVKDFDHFTDHRNINIGDFFDKNLVNLKGARWKNMRSTLSPAFTSSKLRFMFELIDKCAQQIDIFLLKEFEKQKGSGKKEIKIKQELKELFTRFTNDAIATSVFGIEIDSLSDPQNEFFLRGKDLTDLSSGIRGLKSFLAVMAPFLLKVFFGGELFNQESVKYFHQLIEKNLEKRRKEKIVRPDMIHLLMEAQENENKAEDLTDEDIFSQAILFFFAGFDTISTTLSIAAHQLAEFPEVQEKLAQEIDQKLKENKGVITYDILMKDMPYMDMVLNETQRRIPAAAATDRVCTKTYTFPASGNSPEYKVNPGHQVWIPIYGFHHDEEYFPNPDKLIPERWSDESQHNLNVFMPFGIGPRICIANRFARMESKLALFYLLKNSKLFFIEETENPIKFKFSGFTTVNKHGYWLGIKPRN